MKVIRPDENEAPLAMQRPARANPGIPAAVIRFALLTLVAAAIALALLVLRG